MLGMKKILKPLIVGNWKLTPGSLNEAKERYLGIVKASKKFKSAVDVVVCPPAAFISNLSALKKKRYQ